MSDLDAEMTSVYAQARAIAAGPESRRRQFRALEVRCQGCGELMAEVLKTSPWWTVRRQAADVLQSPPDLLKKEQSRLGGHVPSVAATRALFRQATRSMRGREWGLIVIDQNDPERYAKTGLGLICRCRSVADYGMSMILDAIAAGTEKFVISR